MSNPKEAYQEITTRSALESSIARETAAMQQDLDLRLKQLQNGVSREGADAMLVTSNVNLLYLTGVIADAYLLVPAVGVPVRFVRRRGDVDEREGVSVRKPEDMPAWLADRGIPLPGRVLLEDEDISASDWRRLSALFRESLPGSGLLRALRAVKTPYEIEVIRRTALRHTELYRAIPRLYQAGMTELEFSAEIEREARRSGHLGVFRAFGRRMEIFMGSILSGDNAGAVSPFDFALGGRGQHPSVPVGMTGGPLRPGTTVMVDVSGNWEGYLTDQTRVFRIGEIPEEAYRAHRVALAIQEEIARRGLPGTSCGVLYDIAVAMAATAGLGDRFMGADRQARFVGHGTGIEINEPPVIAAGSRATLQAGNVIALEPKFVIPQVGAVGIENTWLVTETGMEKLTAAPEEILPLD